MRFGAFVAAAVVVLVVLHNTMSNHVAGGTEQYTADFSNVSGLRPGDDVRAAGVKVGRVEDVGLAGETARVTFTVAREQPIYRDTRMSVRYQNLLGQRYLALLPSRSSRDSGAVRRLDAGAHIGVDHTDPGFDLTALLNGFEPLFATLEPEQVNQLSRSIVAVMQGEGGTLESLLTETATLTDHLAEKDEVVGRVLEGLTPVLQDLAARGDELTGTVDDLRALMRTLAEERSSIGDSIDGVSELSGATADLVTDMRKPVAKDVEALREFARIAVREQERLLSIFETLPVATSAFARPMSHGSWLNLYICNMSIKLGDATINLGPTSGSYSEVCR